MSETIPPEEPANQHPATAAMNLFIGAVAALESLDTDELVRGDWRLADATRESLVKAADRLEGFKDSPKATRPMQPMPQACSAYRPEALILSYVKIPMGPTASCHQT